MSGGIASQCALGSRALEGGHGSPSPAMEWIKSIHATRDDLKPGMLVVVYAPWCPACQATAPQVQRAFESVPSQLKPSFRAMDVGGGPESNYFGVPSVPKVLFVRDPPTKEVEEMREAKTAEAILGFWKSQLASFPLEGGGWEDQTGSVVGFVKGVGEGIVEQGANIVTGVRNLAQGARDLVSWPTLPDSLRYFWGIPDEPIAITPSMRRPGRKLSKEERRTVFRNAGKQKEEVYANLYYLIQEALDNDASVDDIVKRGGPVAKRILFDMGKWTGEELTPRRALSPLPESADPLGRLVRRYGPTDSDNEVLTQFRAPGQDVLGQSFTPLPGAPSPPRLPNGTVDPRAKEARVQRIHELIAQRRAQAATGGTQPPGGAGPERGEFRAM